MIGKTVGSYRVIATLGEGGMGTVYLAEHELLGKRAAIKVLNPELRANSDVVGRFFNEAKATSQLRHPGIVEVYDFGYLPSGDGYLVMELLDGVSLGARLKSDGPLAERDAARILRAVCGALAAAHARGIIHRDLKPDNIFLAEDPEAPNGLRPKLLDFGIAKLTDPSLANPRSLTLTGTLMGTPRYMSPEQCRGAGEVDHRTDLYSLGCIYYELVTGRAPFANAGSGEIIGAHLFLDPDPPSQHAAVSPRTEALILRLLAKAPAARPQTAVEVIRELCEITGEPYRPSQPEVPPASTRKPTGPDLAPTVAQRRSSTIDESTTLPAKRDPSHPSTLTAAASQAIAVRMPVKRRALAASLGAITLVAIGVIVAREVTSRTDHAAATAPAPPPVPADAAREIEVTPIVDAAASVAPGSGVDAAPANIDAAPPPDAAADARRVDERSPPPVRRRRPPRGTSVDAGAPPAITPPPHKAPPIDAGTFPIDPEI